MSSALSSLNPIPQFKPQRSKRLMTFKSMTRLLWLALITLTLTCALSAAPAASQENAQGKASLHVASSSGLHQAVVAHSAKVTQARSDLTRVLSHPQVRAQVKKFGAKPDMLRQQLAGLSDTEILELQSQIMPLAEQMEAAGQDDGNKKKILLITLGVVIALLTLAMFMFFS